MRIWAFLCVKTLFNRQQAYDWGYFFR